MEAREGARAMESSLNVNNSEYVEQAPSQHIRLREDLITVTEPLNQVLDYDKIDEETSPPITHALEALLGGLDPADEATVAKEISSEETRLESSATYLDTEPREASIAFETPFKESSLVPSALPPKGSSAEAAVNNEIKVEEIEALPKTSLEALKATITGVEPSHANDIETQKLSAQSPAELAELSKVVIPGLTSLFTGSEGGTRGIQQPSAQPNAAVQEPDIQMIDEEPTSNQALEHEPQAQAQSTISEASYEPVIVSRTVIPSPVSLANGTQEDDQSVPESTFSREQVGVPRSVTTQEVVMSEGDSQIESRKSTTSTLPTDVPEVQIDHTGTADEANDEAEHPEWEVDSSPIESSSDDSSSDDSSSDESEEGDNAYKLLSPEEQARILMQGDGDSEDEGSGKAKGASGPLRTKNEVPDVVIPKPDVVITENMPITELGVVEQIVEQILLIKAKTSGEYKVLESGSVLCLANRAVIGVVAETIGRVQQPFYSVLFTNAGELKAVGLSTGVKIFYSEQYSTFVFTQALKAYKGSDASNLHDEEVGDEEMEFSDDEAEHEHKRRVKQKKIERRGDKSQQNGTSKRGGHLLQQQHGPYNPVQGISYDDNDDGPYKPLARPVGYADTIGRSEAPQENVYSGNPDYTRNQGREQFRGRGRGDRGRGDRDRGRGRVDRGRGRGGYQDRRNSSGFSLPPQSQPPSNFQPSPSPTNFSQPTFSAQTFSQPSPNAPSFYNPSPGQYSPNQPQYPAWPQFQHPSYQASQQQAQLNTQTGWPNMSHLPPLPPASPHGMPGGAFLNPAFFNQNNQGGNPVPWNQQNQRGGRGGGGI